MMADFNTAALEPGPVRDLYLTCHLNAAQAALLLNLYKDAIEHASAAIDVDGCSIKGLYRRAVANYAMEQFQAALSDFQAALELDPKLEIIIGRIDEIKERLILSQLPGQGIRHVSQADVSTQEALRTLILQCQAVRVSMSANPVFFPLQVLERSLQHSSVFSVLALQPEGGQTALLAASDALRLAPLRRALGSMAGMAIADAIGHNFEFLPVRDVLSAAALRDTGVFLEYPCEVPGGRVVGQLNQFCLQPGQWTDDASMGLCIADSLICSGGKYDGSSVR